MMVICNSAAGEGHYAALSKVRVIKQLNSRVRECVCWKSSGLGTALDFTRMRAMLHYKRYSLQYSYNWTEIDW